MEPEGGIAPRPRLPAEEIEGTRHSRRHPNFTQFDYHAVKGVVDGLAAELRSIPHPVEDVLDVFCGSRPYDDLLPPGSRSVGLDIDDVFGVADVVSTEFLPFEDDSFDLVMCIGGFYYVHDPARGAAELMRVLRPGGTVILSMPHVWEYDPNTLEHRFTAPQLEALFGEWDATRVVETGGRGAAWATFTGRIVRMVERRLPEPLERLVKPLFGALYALVNTIGLAIEAAERRLPADSPRLPMSLMLVARRPSAT